MATKNTSKVPFIQSLDRGLTILQAVATSRHPVSLNELADLLDVDRSSAFRLAQTLRRRGYLTHPNNQKDYILGSAIWTISQYYDWGNMLVRVAHAELKSMAARINETGHLAIREGKSVLFIDFAHASHVIAVTGHAGELMPLHCSAHGKALLADADIRELTTLFGSGPLEKFTDSTITSLSALAAECAVIKKRGYATDGGEFQNGMRCVAAPIRLQSGMIVGSIGISAPAGRFLEEHNTSNGKKVLKAAKNIGALLSASEDESSTNS
jgi:DNA-binding IclR family transcriptional regulator